MKIKNQIKIGFLAILVVFLSVYMPGYVKGDEQPEHVDSFIVLADLHTDKNTSFDENSDAHQLKVLKGALRAAEQGSGHVLSNVISAGDAFTVCYDQNDQPHLDKHIGSTVAVTEAIQSAFVNEENKDVPVKYVWSDHDRYADIFYEVTDWNTLAGEPIEETKKSQFIYGAGEDGTYGTADDENYYVYSLSMADMANPDNDDRYSSGFHDQATREFAMDEFVRIANTLDNSKPLFIASHQPLFAKRGDNDYALAWYECISAVAEHRDVAFFFGHNHKYDTDVNLDTNGELLPNPYFYPYGSEVKIAYMGTENDKEKGEYRTINFTHFCAGYLAPTNDSDNDGCYTRRGTLVGVDLFEDRIGYTTYDQYGVYTGKAAVDTYEMRRNTVYGKTDYIRGEELDLTVVYQGVDISDKVEISGYNPDAPGAQTVTITYGDYFKAYFDVTVGDNTYYNAEYDVTVVADDLMTQDMSVSMLGINRYHMHVFYRVFHKMVYTTGYQITKADGSRNGNYKVTLPIHDLHNPIVYRLSADATDTYLMDTKVEGDYITFETDELGVFMLGDNPISEPYEKNCVVQQTKTVYVPAKEIRENGNYILVGEIGHGGERVAYANNAGAEGALSISIVPSRIEAVDGMVYDSYIETDDQSIIWTAKKAESGHSLHNDGYSISYTDDNTLTAGAATADLTYDNVSNRIKNVSGDEKYLYYSVHEDQMWNWHADYISESQSSRNMWLYEAVEVPCDETKEYSVYTPNNEVEMSYMRQQKRSLEYDLMLGDEIVDASVLGGTWKFSCPSDSIVDSISEDGIVTFNAVNKEAYVKMEYVWGEQNEYSVYRYVKLVPHRALNYHAHNYVYEVVQPTEDTDGYRGYRCLNCYDYSLIERLDSAASEETQDGGITEGQSVSVENLLFPAAGETLGAVPNKPNTLTYDGNYFVKELKWERFDGEEWKTIHEAIVPSEEKACRVAMTLLADEGYTFDPALAEGNVILNGEKAVDVSVGNKGKEVSFTYIFGGNGVEELPEEATEQPSEEVSEDASEQEPEKEPAPEAPAPEMPAEPVSLKKAVIKFTQKSYQYNKRDGYVTLNFGGETPDAIVTLKVGKETKTLVEGVDFRAVYKNNDRVGKATLTIEGIGNYKGSAKKTFKITPIPLTEDMLYKRIGDVVYSKAGATVEDKLMMYCKGRVMMYGKDFTLKYSGNKDLGKAKVTIIGKGNFTGKIQTEFNIIPQDISNTSVTVKPIAYKAKEGYKYKFSVTVKDGKKKLTKNKDYEVITTEITKENLDAWYAGTGKAPTITIRAKEKSCYVYEKNVPVSVYRYKLSTKNTILVMKDIEIGSNTYSFKQDVYYSDDAKVIKALKKEKNADALNKLIEEKLASNELRLLEENSDYELDGLMSSTSKKSTLTLKVKGIWKYAGGITNKYTIIK
ncbi:MAG: hypothetical protein E7288_01845 [Lachnospiraceae bacterium]|nr:hypothetical protein [Lachnospiraceae bacterium]